jgi:hypothetical protein
LNLDKTKCMLIGSSYRIAHIWLSVCLNFKS